MRNTARVMATGLIGIVMLSPALESAGEDRESLPGRQVKIASIPIGCGVSSLILQTLGQVSGNLKLTSDKRNLPAPKLRSCPPGEADPS